MAIHPGRPLLPADVGAALAEVPPSRWLATTPIHLRACMAEDIALPRLSGVLSATMPLPADLRRRWSAGGRHRSTNLWLYRSRYGGPAASGATGQWRICEGISARQEAEETWVAVVISTPP